MPLELSRRLETTAIPVGDSRGGYGEIQAFAARPQAPRGYGQFLKLFVKSYLGSVRGAGHALPVSVRDALYRGKELPAPIRRAIEGLVT